MNFSLKARRCLVATVIFATGAVVPAITNSAGAASQADCEGGAFKIILPSGRTVSGDGAIAKVDTSKLSATALVKFRGKYIEFDYAPVTGNIYNYVYTGADNADSMSNGQRLAVMKSKTLNVGAKLTKEADIRIEGEHARIISRGKSEIKVKIQAKDCATGGLFQHEVEGGTNVVATHTLAEGMYYYLNPYTGKINFGNGAGFVGKDSPQVATKLSQSDLVSSWNIASGGRMGQVIGEDAVETGAGPTNCVHDCQAQNRVRGSLPVTDPLFNS